MSSSALARLPVITKDSMPDMKKTIVYKGDSGTGKTFNAFTWPGPIVAAYFDKNIETI